MHSNVSVQYVHCHTLEGGIQDQNFTQVYRWVVTFRYMALTGSPWFRKSLNISNHIRPEIVLFNMHMCATYFQMPTKQGHIICFHYLVLKSSGDNKLYMHVVNLCVVIENAIFISIERSLPILYVVYCMHISFSQTIVHLCSREFSWKSLVFQQQHVHI